MDLSKAKLPIGSATVRNLLVSALIALTICVSSSASAFAATYYVSPNGSNGNAGTVDKPWATLSYGESRLKAGDTLVVRGGTYSEALWVDVSNAVIKNYTGETPVIDGRSSLPGGDEYGSLVTIAAGGVTIDGLEIKNSSARGVTISNSDRCTIKNTYIHNSQREGIVVDHGSDYAVVEGNHVADSNLVMSPRWPAVQAVSCTNVTFRRNIVHGSTGEGICLGRKVDTAVIEYNTVYDCGRGHIYSDWSRNVVIRYNLVYETRQSVYGSNGAGGYGIMLANEEWDLNEGYDNNIQVYGNLVADCCYSFVMDSNREGYPVKNVKVYNNSFVEPYGAPNDSGFPPTNLYLHDQYSGRSDVVFKNNLIVNSKSNGRIAAVPKGPVFSNNVWSVAPENDAKGSNDIIAVPKLAKTSGWNSIAPGSLTGAEFALQPGSPGIDAGANLGSEFNQGLDCDSSNWNIGSLTFLSQDGQGSAWDVGADVYSAGSSGQQLAAPTNLRITNVNEL